MNELQVKILEVTPAIVKFNFEEMMKVAKEIKEEYEGLIFTEVTVKDGKKTVAELKKIQKSVNDFKIKTKKDLTQSVSDFETQCKTIISEFDEPIEFISTQLDEFEIKRVKDKTDRINFIIQNGYTEIGIEAKFQTVEHKPDWTNSTKKESDIIEEISYQLKILVAAQDKYYQDIELVMSYVEVANVSLNVKLSVDQFVKMLDYKTAKDIKESIQESLNNQKAQEIAYTERLERESQRKIDDANREAARQIEEITEVVAEMVKPIKVEASDPTKTITFKCKVTKSQYDALINFIAKNQIEYKVI